MRVKKLLTIAIVLSTLYRASAQDAKSFLQEVAQQTGAAGLKSIQYSGSGYIFWFGQNPHPQMPWPKFNAKSYARLADYEGSSLREEFVRTQFENPPRGGGFQPVIGEDRQAFFVSGNYAWNVLGSNVVPAPATVEERLLQIWMTPHGLIKAALAATPTIKSETVGGRKRNVVSFTALGRFRVNGIFNDQNQVERVESWIPNPLFGDMPVEASYADYRDFSGLKFPAKIVHKQGGFPTLDISVTEVRPNFASDIQVPDTVRQAPAPAVRVESKKLADGVWLIGGGSHNSVAVEFKDHVTVVEGPQNEDRSLAVLAEVKKLVPGKAVRYLVNTHHHVDHSGGIRTYAAEGAILVTHEINRPFYERIFRSPRTLAPDKLAQSGKKAAFLAIKDKHVLSDGARTLELHRLRDNGHNDGLIVAYLPEEKLLIEADVFSPLPPGAPVPQPPHPYFVNFYDNIRRLKLQVNQIAPVHGAVAPLAELLRIIGATSSE